MGIEKFQNKYRIPSARAVWHDYNGGDYFITICTAHRVHYFGKIVDAKMVLNAVGQKLNELIEDVKTHNPYVEIPVYQIMPNHVHLIVCINGADADCREIDSCKDAACHVSTTKLKTGKNEKMQNIAEKCGLLSTVMGGLKSALTKYVHLNKIEFDWQSRFHDHIIRDQEEMNRIAIYIENNPATWENDQFYSK